MPVDPAQPSARTHVAFLGGLAMDYEEVAPPPELAPWVAVSWRVRARDACELRVLPDGCMDIIDGEVVGSLTEPLVARFETGDMAAGVRFHPGGLPALLGVPASELLDLQVPLDDLLPPKRSLRSLARDAEPPDPLAAAAYRARSLDGLRRATSYSERQIRRRVLQATGHSPKRLMRIGRMQRLLLAGRRGSWARAAAEHGFFDESHMVNDIRDLAGASPRSLVSMMAVPSKAGAPGSL